MKKIKLHDKEFRRLLQSSAIDLAIQGIAQRLNKDLKEAEPLFISVLNGSFMFTSDLIKQITIPGTEVNFIKIASYKGTSSTGQVKQLIGFNDNVEGRVVVILEDMIESGESIAYLVNLLKDKKVAKVIIVSMFFKPKAIKSDVRVDYYALALDNDFVVGRGLDYNGLGRNLPDLYVLCE